MQWHELTAWHQLALVARRRAAHRVVFIFVPALTMVDQMNSSKKNT